MSASSSVKSKTEIFSRIRAVWADLGMGMTPLCMSQRSTICDGVFIIFVGQLLDKGGL